MQPLEWDYMLFSMHSDKYEIYNSFENHTVRICCSILFFFIGDLMKSSNLLSAKDESLFRFILNVFFPCNTLSFYCALACLILH